MRNNIGKLIGDEIVLTPNQDEYLTATLQGNYAGLLELVDKKSKLSLVAGARLGRNLEVVAKHRTEPQGLLQSALVAIPADTYLVDRKLVA